MYVRNGRLVMTKIDSDLTLRRRGEDILKTRYNLSLSDLPELLKKIGVLGEEDVELNYADEDYRRLVISVKDKDEEFSLELWRASREINHPFICIRGGNDYKKIFEVKREITVKNLG